MAATFIAFNTLPSSSVDKVLNPPVTFHESCFKKLDPEIGIVWNTDPATNIKSPWRQAGPQKENSVPTFHFQVQTVSSGEGNPWSITKNIADGSEIPNSHRLDG